jgi:hypothetical protein
MALVIEIEEDGGFKNKGEGRLEEGQFCPFELFFSESASSNPIQQ